MNFGIINIFNSFVVIILLIPNLIYAIKHSKFKIIYKSIQLLGMFACIESMILMVFPIGINEFGFGSSEEMLIYVFYNITLISVYNILWRLFNKQKRIHFNTDSIYNIFIEWYRFKISCINYIYCYIWNYSVLYNFKNKYKEHVGTSSAFF